MGELILAIDGGSQSTKVSLVDATGRVHSEHRVALRPLALSADGRAVHPDDDLWDSLVEACRGLGDLSEVVAVGLCSIRFCRSYLRDDLQLAEPVLSWMDARVDEPPDDAAAYVTTASGYLTARLTGELVDTSANQAGWWPMDPRAWRWPDDDAVLADKGVERRQLARLVDPGELLGEVSTGAASACGIPRGTPVFATANDKAVEALGCGLLEPGALLLSLGTYIAAMRMTEEPVPGTWTNYACMPGRYLAESDGIRRGMWTVSWLAETFGEPVADLNTAAAQVPAGCEGLLTVLDWLAPGSHPHRRGSFLGMTGRHGRAHLYRSVLEGICLTMADHAEALGAAPEVPLVLSGGGSRSDLMLQIAADVFDRPVRRMEQPDAAGLGAAICAAVGQGLHDSFESAAEAMVRLDREVRPGLELSTYANARRRHARARAALDELYRDLA